MALVQGGVEAGAHDEFGVRAAFDDASVLEDEDQVSGEHGGQAVRDDQRGAPGEQRAQRGWKWKSHRRVDHGPDRPAQH